MIELDVKITKGMQERGVYPVSMLDDKVQRISKILVTLNGWNSIQLLAYRRGETEEKVRERSYLVVMCTWAKFLSINSTGTHTMTVYVKENDSDKKGMVYNRDILSSSPHWLKESPKIFIKRQLLGYVFQISFHFQVP